MVFTLKHWAAAELQELWVRIATEHERPRSWVLYGTLHNLDPIKVLDEIDNFVKGH